MIKPFKYWTFIYLGEDDLCKIVRLAVALALSPKLCIVAEYCRFHLLLIPLHTAYILHLIGGAQSWGEVISLFPFGLIGFSV